MARRRWLQGAIPVLCAVALMQGACDEEVRVDCSQRTEWESCLRDRPDACEWTWTDRCVRRCDDGEGQCDEGQVCQLRDVWTGGEATVVYEMVCIDE